MRDRLSYATVDFTLAAKLSSLKISSSSQVFPTKHEHMCAQKTSMMVMKRTSVFNVTRGVLCSINCTFRWEKSTRLRHESRSPNTTDISMSHVHIFAFHSFSAAGKNGRLMNDDDDVRLRRRRLRLANGSNTVTNRFFFLQIVFRRRGASLAPVPGPHAVHPSPRSLVSSRNRGPRN